MGNVIFTIFDFLNLFLVLLLWIYTLRIYKKLPATIPTHFDFEGKADRFGNKKFSFLMPFLGLIAYIFLGFATANPQSANYPVAITEANKDHQFFIMILFLKWLLFLVLLLFLNIQDYMIRYSFNSSVKAKVPILLIFPVIFLSLIAAIITASFYK